MIMVNDLYWIASWFFVGFKCLNYNHETISLSRNLQTLRENIPLAESYLSSMVVGGGCKEIQRCSSSHIFNSQIEERIYQQQAHCSTNNTYSNTPIMSNASYIDSKCCHANTIAWRKMMKLFYTDWIVGSSGQFARISNIIFYTVEESGCLLVIQDLARDAVLQLDFNLVGNLWLCTEINLSVLCC